MARYPVPFSSGGLLGGWPADPFMTLHREMNRLFDDVARGGGVASAGGQSEGGGAMLAPHMDVSETDKELRVKAELPGVAEKDIEVSLNEDVLTIRAEKRQERKQEKEGVHFSERSFGTFQRALRLPFHVQSDQVQAKFENGVLEITLPKMQAQARSRRIEVQGSRPQASASQPSTGQNQDTAQLSGSSAASGNGSSASDASKATTTSG